ncbi:MAG TPA: hypothetical protein VEY88_21395, partial [Archangium sp.]|nr:hypothetical protein [Archangium sp.]
AQLLTGDGRAWHMRTKELLKKLYQSGRLVPHASAKLSSPVTDEQWCDEALATHENTPLSGVIVPKTTVGSYARNPLVSSIERLATAPWWADRSCSIRLNRTLADYQTALRLVLRHANHLMFIDPHLDPLKRGYEDFGALLQSAGQRSPRPRIELHRVAYQSAGQKRVFLDLPTLEKDFRDKLGGPLRDVGLEAEVYIWDDFHDRYVISNLIGISVPNGFDTSNAATARTTWTRLGRADRDDVQKEFHPSANRHAIRRRFVIS